MIVAAMKLRQENVLLCEIQPIVIWAISSARLDIAKSMFLTYIDIFQ